jgi:hypothetical protein
LAFGGQWLTGKKGFSSFGDWSPKLWVNEWMRKSVNVSMRIGKAGITGLLLDNLIKGKKFTIPGWFIRLRHWKL